MCSSAGGREPFVSEFSADGELLFDGQLGASYLSYRAFRLPWKGGGEGAPALFAERTGSAYAGLRELERRHAHALLGRPVRPTCQLAHPARRAPARGLRNGPGGGRGTCGTSQMRSVDESGNVLGQSEIVRV